MLGPIFAFINNSGRFNSQFQSDFLQSLYLGPLYTTFYFVLLILAFTVFWLPSDIAKARGHNYLLLIQVLNIAALFSFGTAWLFALAWSVFPSEKSLLDPIAGNPTGLGQRNSGDTIGAAQHGVIRGKTREQETDQQIVELISMRTKGLISDEEFLRMKSDILNRP